MAEAIKNSGLIFGSLLTVFIATICVYQQHVLMKCSEKLEEDYSLNKRPDYAETLELSLMSNKKWAKHAKTMKRICNIFLIVTQFGFCSVYFLFIGNNMKNVLDFYGFVYDIKLLMLFSLAPIILTSLITNLRYLGKYTKTELFTTLIIISRFAQLRSQGLPTFVCLPVSSSRFITRLVIYLTLLRGNSRLHLCINFLCSSGLQFICLRALDLFCL